MLGVVEMDEVEREATPPDSVQLTWDALENIRLDLMSLASQLRSLKDSSPATVLPFLQARVRCAAWRACVLLRQSAQTALVHNRPEDATEIRRWIRYIDGHSINGGSHIVVLEGSSCNTVEEVPEDEPAASLVRRMTVVRPLKETMIGMTARQHPSSNVAQRPDDSQRFGEFAASKAYCPWLHPFVHAIFAAHVAAPIESQSCDDLGPKPLPHWGCVPWLFPALPFAQFTRCLCLLSPSSRQAVTEEHVQLDMKVESFLLLREVSPDDMAAIEAETDFVRTWLIASTLRETVLCAQLRQAPPANREDIQLVDLNFAAMFTNSRHSEEDTDHQSESAESSVEGSENGHAAEGLGNTAMTDTSERDARTAIRLEMRSAVETVNKLTCEMQKVLFVFDLHALKKGLDEVMALAPAVKAEDDKETRGSLGSPSSVQAHDVAKTQALVVFNRLRQRGTRVRTKELYGPATYVLREHDIDECVEDLGQRLLHWGRLQVEAQFERSADQIADMAAQVRLLENSVLQNDWDKKTREADMEATIVSAVADRGSRQLFEVDRLNRIVNALSSASYEMEHRLNAEVCNKVLDHVGNLETEVAEARVRFSEYVGSMRSTVSDEVQSLRQSVLQQLRKLSHQNFVLQSCVKNFEEEWQTHDTSADKAAVTRQSTVVANEDRAALAAEIAERKALQARVAVKSESGQQDEVTEAEIEAVHGELNELRNARVRIQTLFSLKFQRLHQAFEEQIQKLTLTVSSNNELWERVSEVRERERIADEELARSQRRVAAATATIERLTDQAAREANLSTKLESWKERAWQRLGALQKEAIKYERNGIVDLKRIEHDVAMLDEALSNLSRGDKGDLTDERREAETTRARIIRRILRHQIQEEKMLTQKAQKKSDLIRREMEVGEAADNESLVILLCDEYRDVLEQCAKLEADNERMRSSIAATSHVEVVSRGPRATLMQSQNLTRARSNTKTPKSSKQQPAVRSKSEVRASLLDKPNPLDAVRNDQLDDMLCYSMGLSKAPKLPWFRSQIDTVRAGLVSDSSMADPIQEAVQKNSSSGKSGMLAAAQDLRAALGSRSMLAEAGSLSARGNMAQSPDLNASGSMSARSARQVHGSPEVMVSAQPSASVTPPPPQEIVRTSTLNQSYRASLEEQGMTNMLPSLQRRSTNRGSASDIPSGRRSH
eukprot:gnl/TRDRNA2_/TRDRNA2_133361_c0_seq1.p1 gnl/TRDRNA2_/TRDRNA2_133361_c0~~gnl/TRDRNA2_/TRDRNA2_133361_c0_seq1.p1  ORF type:complete len:1380 (+),score=268.15 gnl/TRDRNA2_/TRDRNA2_133361_c0_seq1:606-4142(+)